MEVRSSGSLKNNLSRSPVVLPLKFFHNSGIGGATKTEKVFQPRNAFIT
jgi:hypothetical protein